MYLHIYTHNWWMARNSDELAPTILTTFCFSSSVETLLFFSINVEFTHLLFLNMFATPENSEGHTALDFLNRLCFSGMG